MNRLRLLILLPFIVAFGAVQPARGANSVSDYARVAAGVGVGVVASTSAYALATQKQLVSFRKKGFSDILSSLGAFGWSNIFNPKVVGAHFWAPALVVPAAFEKCLWVSNPVMGLPSLKCCTEWLRTGAAELLSSFAVAASVDYLMESCTTSMQENCRYVHTGFEVGHIACDSAVQECTPAHPLVIGVCAAGIHGALRFLWNKCKKTRGMIIVTGPITLSSSLSLAYAGTIPDADVIAASKSDRNMLEVAAAYGDVERVDACLKAGHNPNVPDASGTRRPLVSALALLPLVRSDAEVRKAMPIIVQKLIESGAGLFHPCVPDRCINWSRLVGGAADTSSLQPGSLPADLTQSVPVGDLLVQVRVIDHPTLLTAPVAAALAARANNMRRANGDRTEAVAVATTNHTTRQSIPLPVAYIITDYENHLTPDEEQLQQQAEAHNKRVQEANGEVAVAMPH